LVYTLQYKLLNVEENISLKETVRLQLTWIEAKVDIAPPLSWTLQTDPPDGQSPPNNMNFMFTNFDPKMNHPNCSNASRGFPVTFII